MTSNKNNKNPRITKKVGPLAFLEAIPPFIPEATLPIRLAPAFATPTPFCAAVFAPPRIF